MRVLIVEDERAAARKLEALVCEIEPSAVVVKITESVQTTVDYLKNNESPELIFMDIRLADGMSFELFHLVEVKSPVIFTTAYDAYMQNAFKVNSIDYLLKPVDKEELRAALKKYHSLYPTQIINERLLQEKVFQILSQYGKNPGNNAYKTRFLVKEGNNLLTIPVEEVAYLHADRRLVFLHTVKGKKYFVDESLDQLEKVLEPFTFFRLNRSYMAPINSIEKVEKHFKGKLMVILKQLKDSPVFVSREKATGFRQWLGK